MTVAARMMIAMAIIAVGSHLLKMEIRKKSKTVTVQKKIRRNLFRKK